MEVRKLFGDILSRGLLYLGFYIFVVILLFLNQQNEKFLFELLIIIRLLFHTKRLKAGDDGKPQLFSGK